MSESVSMTLDELLEALNQFSHPHCVEGWASTDFIWQKQDQTYVLAWPFASQSMLYVFQTWLKDKALPVSLEVSLKVKPLKTVHGNQVPGVKNIIAVTSAKGGVGKSSTAVNLALALSKSGAKVGILDADIYGPSVPIMLGTKGQSPQIMDQKWMQPVPAHGIYSQSIGYLVSPEDATIWRGPMASKALMQLVNETKWPDLDYLVLDMPPGTGDIQLTLAQQIPVTGAVVVTTPQDLALADAIKGVAMFDKVEVPVVGLIENMSYHVCENCGHHSHIFGQNGSLAMAREHDLAVLGQVPLNMSVRQSIDAGMPTMAKNAEQLDDLAEQEIAKLYQEMADQIAARIYWQGEVSAETILFTQA